MTVTQAIPAMLRSALLNVMVAAARKAGRGLRRDFGEVEKLQVSLKGPANFVSSADRRAPARVRGATPFAEGYQRRARRSRTGKRRHLGLELRSQDDVQTDH